jgi:ribosomal peptide maturation radical SAM protein 1
VRKVDVPFESSRGCWWGQKATCRFCGLNGSTMSYRAKSPERVLRELETLAKRHRSLSFNAADNIMSRDHLHSVMAPLASSNVDYWLFYEVKANLSRPDIKLLGQAGVRALQPGIESLSSHVLRLMLKGAKASTNVNLLRWARYYGIETHWNILFGFPGETVEDYADQQLLARQMVHLQPPGGFLRIGLERFSPYFENPDEFPVRGGPAVPEPGYAHTYPKSVDLGRAAYHFAGELEGSLSNAAYQPLIGTLQAWHERWAAGQRPSLTFWWATGLLHVEDRRSALAPASYSFEDPHAAIYLAACDAAVTPDEVARRLDLSKDAVAEAIAEFCRLGLMMRDGAVVLSLALPGTPGR